MTETNAPMVETTEILPLFPTFVWKIQLKPDNYRQINAAIVHKLGELTRNSGADIAQGKGQTDQALHTLREFEPLNEIVYAAADGVLDFLKIVYTSLRITGCWANISPKGDSHRPHTHPNNYLSGVYYVQTQDGADLISFDDPRPQTNIICPIVREPTDENAGQIHVRVREGLLLLFPSWLQHQVPPNQSERERISIAINLMFSLYGEQMSQPKWKGNIGLT